MNNRSTPIIVKRNDRLPPVHRKLCNADGTAIDLTSATSVAFHMRDATTKVVVVDSPASILDRPGGIVQYDWLTGDTDTAGVYEAEFEVSFANGMVVTVPNDEHMGATIVDDVA